MHTHARTHTHTKDGHSRRVTKMEIIYVQLLYHHGLTGASEDMGLMIALSGSQPLTNTLSHTRTHTHTHNCARSVPVSSQAHEDGALTLLFDFVCASLGLL